MRVLICDDEPSVRLLFRTAIEAEGAEVEEAVDGDDCVARAEISQPDVVILDLYMPRRDGLATLPELRMRCPKAAVIVVSAHAAVEIFEKSRARGATACFDKLAFLPRIHDVLERYGAAA